MAVRGSNLQPGIFLYEVANCIQGLPPNCIRSIRGPLFARNTKKGSSR